MRPRRTPYLTDSRPSAVVAEWASRQLRLGTFIYRTAGSHLTKAIDGHFAFAAVMERRNALQDPEQLSRFDYQAIQIAQDLEAVAAGHQLIEPIPIAQPDPV